LVENFIGRILQPFLKNKLKKSLIILDQATSNKKQEFLEALDELNYEVVFIHARLTGYK
jgi:hypothetical protein